MIAYKIPQQTKSKKLAPRLHQPQRGMSSVAELVPS